jgi:hypothetical protein
MMASIGDACDAALEALAAFEALEALPVFPLDTLEQPPSAIDAPMSPTPAMKLRRVTFTRRTPASSSIAPF